MRAAGRLACAYLEFRSRGSERPRLHQGAERNREGGLVLGREGRVAGCDGPHTSVFHSNADACRDSDPCAVLLQAANQARFIEDVRL